MTPSWVDRVAPSTLPPADIPFSFFLRMSRLRLLNVRLPSRTPAAVRSPTPSKFDASRAFILFFSDRGDGREKRGSKGGRGGEGDAEGGGGFDDGKIENTKRHAA